MAESGCDAPALFLPVFPPPSLLVPIIIILFCDSANATTDNMNNFGVVELASAKHTVAPGWAYVPDTRPKATNFQPTNRKRARNQPGGGPSIGDLSARQEARIRKEVEGLEKDGNRDNGIPVPAHAGSKSELSTLERHGNRG